LRIRKPIVPQKGGPLPQLAVGPASLAGGGGPAIRNPQSEIRNS
jgi:hypothetical protein